MARDREARGANDTNAPIITTDGGRIEKPRNLLSAISEIQQFYVIESKGQNIPAEFLTLERTIDFFKICIFCTIWTSSSAIVTTIIIIISISSRGLNPFVSNSFSILTIITITKLFICLHYTLIIKQIIFFIYII